MAAPGGHRCCLGNVPLGDQSRDDHIHTINEVDRFSREELSYWPNVIYYHPLRARPAVYDGIPRMDLGVYV